MSERVKEKKKLQKQIFKIIEQHVGFKVYPTETEADNSFWQRPQQFLEELEALGDLDIVTEVLKDYPTKEMGEGVQDLKQWKVKIAKKSDLQVRCNLKMTTFGQDEFGGTNKTELAISGGCFIERKKKEHWWQED